MFRKMVVVLCGICAALSAWSMPLDEISETLSRAEALYYEADFTKSIELLSRVDKLLRPQSDRQQEKISVKLHLALAYIGLNDTNQAKVYLRELYALDPDYVVDSQRFSPKVIQFADKAKVEQNEIRCKTMANDAQQQLETGNAEAVMQLLGPNRSKCSGLEPIAAGASEVFFKEGIAAYKKAQMTDALQKFRSAVQLKPDHELASQYIELTQNKLQLDRDRLFLVWRKDFEAGEFGLAAAEYRELISVSNAETVNQVRGEYRRALSNLVEAWNRACASNDTMTMDKLRQRMSDMLPDPSIGEDILAKMTTCTNAGCLPMNAQLALARLKSRVDPDFSSSIRAQIRVPVTVRVKTKISETGDVVAADPQGGNALLYGPVQTAVKQWKFYPTIVPGGDARCVETEIPIVITFRAN